MKRGPFSPVGKACAGGRTVSQALRRGIFLSLLLAMTLLAGCQTSQVEKDYARPLPAGTSALRKLPQSQWPSLTEALRGSDPALIMALDRSLSWYDKPSSRQFFPIEGVTHEQARASAQALRDLLTTSGTMGQFHARFREHFDIYISVGWDGRGEVLYTGYYSPVVRASRTATAEYRYPLYNRPADLVSDPITGVVQGRRSGSELVPYPTRAQIEAHQLLRGQELVWLRDKLDAYVVQVQGSAKLNLTDGSTMLIGYAGNNGHEYTSVGRLLVAQGKLSANTLSLPAIRAYFKSRPHELDRYVNRNDRFVFFKEYDRGAWPAGSLGVEVTPMRTLATDKSVFPRGMPLLVATLVPTGIGGQAVQPFEQFMVDQDTGGAIRAPGRADIYMGTGMQAEHLAGRQLHEGRLYYLILKPEKVQAWATPTAPAPAIR